MAKTALLVVDVQRDFYEASPAVFAAEQVIARIADAVSRARAAGLAVIYVQHTEDPRSGDPLAEGSAGWQLHPRIAPMAGEPVLRKSTPDSFHGTDLQRVLDGLGIESLILAGHQTEFCIDTTCRRARSLGYKVTLLKDAHSTWDNPHLPARQIIDHHNFVLSCGFAAVADSTSIDFSTLG
jgi:nicotinamidase-related amidase